MLYYGKLDEIIRAVEREIELLTSLHQRDERLDAFIKRKIELLKKCAAQLRKLPSGEYQLVAVNSCEIISL